MNVEALNLRASAARAWLFDCALPLWAAAGFDQRTGLFAEKLDRTLTSVPGHRRVRVQARQTYVFVQAGRLGWPGPWRERAEAGMVTLTSAARANDGASGYALDEGGVLIDARRDLYDQAFALFGLASARSLDPPRVDSRIAEILRYLESERGPRGGFLEGELKPRPRWQNPHMHLFEAGLALDEAGAPGGLALAREMSRLFDDFLFDDVNGALGEYYNDDLSRPPGDVGRLAEPGHHFEWIWLLDRWRRRSGEDRESAISRLWSHALEHGVVGGLAIDEVWRDGGVKSGSARLWPQTERLKAALVRFERSGQDHFAGHAVEAFDGLWRYFAGVPAGLWRDRLGVDGKFVEEPSPASSMYHIVLAFSELARVVATI